MVRQRICDGLGCFGIELDAAANDRNDAVVSSVQSIVNVRVVRTDEEQMIARIVQDLLGQRVQENKLDQTIPSQAQWKLWIK